MRKKKKSKHELAIESSQKKVERILRNAFGAKAKKVGWSVPGFKTANVIESAFIRRLGKERAEKFAHDMSDWSGDAGAILVLHLFPERFNREEVKALLLGFMVHVPDHIKAASIHFDLPPSEFADSFIERGNLRKKSTREKNSRTGTRSTS